MIYFLDTSTIIWYLKNDPKIVSQIDNLEGELTSSYICLAELYEGVYRALNGAEKIEEGIKNIFDGLSHIYNIDWEIANKFGQLRAKLKKKGEILEDIDILIAATCLTYNLILVTSNIKHFQRIENLKLLSTYN